MRIDSKAPRVRVQVEKDAHWSESAACAGQDWDTDHDMQRRVCAECPVWTECLDDGLSLPCLYSLARIPNEMPLWAGMTTAELHAESQRRRRTAA